METLFWPFLNAFKYTSISEKDFRTRLKNLRTLLDKPLYFEKILFEKLRDNNVPLMELFPYKTFHRALIDAWKILDNQKT